MINLLGILLFAIRITGLIRSSNTCAHVFTKTGFYCKCDSSYCDTFPVVPKDQDLVYHLFTGKNFPGFNLNAVEVSNFSLSNAIHITINLSDVRHDLIGFGGSFTDSFGYNLRSLSNETQKSLLRSYFAHDGLKYNLCRMPIGSSDFSTHYYDYLSEENDMKLLNFKLQKEDYEYKIYVIHELMEMSLGKELKIVASNWSPPPWMKKNNSTTPAYLKDEYYQLYADYLIRFLEEYRNEGIEFWGITPINEPLTGISVHFPITNLIMLPEQQRSFIAKNLGPSLDDHNFSHIKVIALDDQRKYINWWMDVMKGDAVAYNYTAGIGIHWYYDQFTSPEMMDIFSKDYPEKFIIYTESSINMLFGSNLDIGSWAKGDLYGNSIIENMNHYSSGWIDWNMALDLIGGPNYKGMYCDAPILVDSDKDEFYKQPMYYIIGHFSALTETGSKVLRAKKHVKNSKNRFRREPPTFPLPTGDFPILEEDIDVTSVLNPDGSVVVFVLNRYSAAKNISIVINKENSQRILIEIPIFGLSMNSIIVPIV